MSEKVIKKIGNWTGITRLTRAMDVEIRKANKQSLMKIGLKAEQIAVKHIRNQDLNWQSLSPATVTRKSRLGQSDKTLMATTDYIQAITSYATSDTAFAGVRKRATNRTGEDLTMIAAVLEFGTGDIPERPLWRPTYDETVSWIKSTKILPRQVYQNWNDKL